MTERTAWIDCSSGVSGDMLLGALIGAGAPIDGIGEVLDGLGLPERIELRRERVRRAGILADRVHVVVPDSETQRGLPEILEILRSAPPEIAEPAGRVFTTLAVAEAAAHGVPLEHVHFHEVGALDAIADVVGVVTGFRLLGAERIIASPIALGGGRVSSEHGSLPVPPPAVAQLLATHMIPCLGGPGDAELATPTGVALLATLASGFGPLPLLRPSVIGTGAGGRDPAGHPNVLRIILSAPAAESSRSSDDEGEIVEVAATVDDLDSRLWPGVIDALLVAGSKDAWLTPILGKKGRPAHVVSALVEPGQLPAVEEALFRTTTTIGVRRTVVTRSVLSRETRTVEVAGEEVRVKLSGRYGRILTATPEYEDVAAVARSAGVAERLILRQAESAAAALSDDLR